MTSKSMDAVYARIAADIAAELERRRVHRQRVAILAAIVIAGVAIEVMSRWF